MLLVSNSILSFLLQNMGGNSKFLFKKCSCDEVKRGGEFKRHLNKYKNTPHIHVEKGVVSGCTHCQKFLRGKQHEKFYERHQNCPVVKFANYTTSDIGKIIAPYFELVDLDQELQNAIADIINPPVPTTGNEELQNAIIADPAVPTTGNDLSSDSDTSDESDSEEVVVPVKGIAKPISQSSPKKLKGIKAQTLAWNKDDQAAKVSQEFALNKLKDELSRFRNECETLRGENFNLKAQVQEIKNLKTQVINLEAFRDRALQSEKRVEEQAANIKNLKSQEGVLKLKIEQLKMKMAENEQHKESRTTLHLPIINSRIVDDILLQSEDVDSTFECYEGAMAEMRCIHVSIKHDGDIKELRHRKQKLPAKYLPQPPPSKGSRTG